MTVRWIETRAQVYKPTPSTREVHNCLTSPLLGGGDVWFGSVKVQDRYTLAGPMTHMLARALVDQVVNYSVDKSLIAVVWKACGEGAVQLAVVRHASTVRAGTLVAPKWYRGPGRVCLWDNLTGSSNPFKYDCASHVNVAVRYTGQYPDGGVRNIEWQRLDGRKTNPVELGSLGPMPIGMARELVQQAFDEQPCGKWIVPYRLVGDGLICLGICHVSKMFLGDEPVEPPDWFIGE